MKVDSNKLSYSMRLILLLLLSMLISCASVSQDNGRYSYRTFGQAKIEHCQRLVEEEGKTTRYDCVFVETEGLSGEFSNILSAIIGVLWPF